jgi:hypothetical protein
MAAWCPVYNGREELSRGVEQEKLYAGNNHRPVHVYQDPSQDPKGVCRTAWGAESSPYLQTYDQFYVNFYDSEDDLLDSLE